MRIGSHRYHLLCFIYSYIMSKRSLFWGNASGKLGEAVFFRAGGEQRTRTYVAKIANPKTLAQMQNRVGMANLAAFFRSLKPLLKFSMTDRKSNQSAFNVFVQRSKRLDGAVIGLDAAREGYSIPYGMCVAAGSAGWNPRSAVVALDGVDGLRAIALGAGAAVEAPAAASIVPAQTPEAFKAGLLQMLQARKAWFEGLPLVFNLFAVISEYDDEGFISSWRKITIDGSAIQDFTNAEELEKLKVNGDFSLTRYAVIPFGFHTAEDGLMRIAIGVGGAGGAGNGCYFGAGFIAYKDTQVRVSNAYMMAIEGEDSEYLTQYLPGGEVYNSVMQSLGVAPDSPLAAAAADVVGGESVLPRPSYTITATSNNVEWGTVSGGGTYQEGDSCTLTATKKGESEFQRWSDGVTTNPRTFVVSSSLSVQAIFSDPDDDGGLAG